MKPRAITALILGCSLCFGITRVWGQDDALTLGDLSDLATAAPSLNTPVEPDANIDDQYKGDTLLFAQAVTLVRRAGYVCDTISALQSLETAQGMSLRCNGGQYTYKIAEKDDGTLSATMER